ncbi:hypothetical protein PPK16_gp54 [Bacillus phage 049ML001]|uniref:Uncharacterized protein n=1 Tax=Bacillus phage 049ML001 TaxID=2601660 RepID=A0A5P8PI06_9CAUD|nr:hypothetical protein PPK16_gp54 [Bacillus phage 049ML001]QFR56357.1 hypothetical protein 049ML001_54 [Bacillus phage 049ML001]QFR56437.1 hypothetical protein 049ML003_54 [Bacillus phage 049ML003]
MNIVDLLDERGRTYRFHNVDKLATAEGIKSSDKNTILRNIIEQCKEHTHFGATFALLLEVARGTLVISAKKTATKHPYWNIYFD